MEQESGMEEKCRDGYKGRDGRDEKRNGVYGNLGGIRRMSWGWICLKFHIYFLYIIVVQYDYTNCSIKVPEL